MVQKEIRGKNTIPSNIVPLYQKNLFGVLPLNCANNSTLKDFFETHEFAKSIPEIGATTRLEELNGLFKLLGKATTTDTLRDLTSRIARTVVGSPIVDNIIELDKVPQEYVLRLKKEQDSENLKILVSSLVDIILGPKTHSEVVTILCDVLKNEKTNVGKLKVIADGIADAIHNVHLGYSPSLEAVKTPALKILNEKLKAKPSNEIADILRTAIYFVECEHLDGGF